MIGACLKKRLVYYATISYNDKNYTKEVAQQVLKSAKKIKVTKKNHLTYHCTKTIASFQQSIGT